MLRGNGLGAFLAAIAQQLISFAYDTIHAARSSSKPPRNAPQSITSTLFGWPPPPLDPARETAWLDGLRGLAAFLVMTYHYHLAWYGIDLEGPYGTDEHHRQLWRLPFIRIFVCSGHAQVSTFFVLSGFVLSWSGLKSIRYARYDRLAQTLASATFRRWLRLFLPCFIIGIIPLIQVLCGKTLLGVDRKANFLWQCWDYIWACEMFANPLFLERTEFQAVHMYNWTMWTIPYEYAGSLLVFLLLLGVGRVRRYGRRTLIILGVAVYACLHAQWNYWLFITGVLVADYVQQAGGFEGLSRRTSPAARAVWVALFIAGLYLAGLPEKLPGYEFLNGWTPYKFLAVADGGARFWWCWSGIMLIISACHIATIRSFFELSILRHLGRISYMLYLTHRNVHECVGVFLRKSLLTAMGTQWSDEFGINPHTSSTPVQITSYIGSWLVLLPIAMSVAHWCEVLVDRPCTRFARWADDMFGKDVKLNATREEELGLLPSWTNN